MDAAEERLLTSPIVLLRRLSDSSHPATQVADARVTNPSLGVLLPSNPLHHLLTAEFGAPLVATMVSAEGACAAYYQYARTPRKSKE